MKPMIILPPNQMSEANIKLLRENGICVVVAKDPTKVRFVDPIPAVSSRTEIETAAIKLSRKVMNPGYWRDDDTRKQITVTFFDLICKGTSLDANGSKEEQDARLIESARLRELERIAREEVRAEKAAEKAKQIESKKDPSK